MISGIYAIINILNDKIYVGSSFNMRERWSDHRWYFKNNRHNNRYMQNVWNKHWVSPFLFVVLEYVESIKNTLYERENYWIERLKPEYNLTPVAGSPLGFKHSKVSIKKMQKPKSDSHREAIAQARKGMKFDETHSANISLAKKGKSIDGSASAKSRIGKKRGSYKRSFDNLIKDVIIIASTQEE